MKRVLLILAVLLCFGMGVQAQSVPTATLTPTPDANQVVVPNAVVRGGPGRQYPRVGSLADGRIVTPVNRNAAGDWILIRYFRGFGWIQRDLVYWVDNVDALPVLDEFNLTPSPIPGRVSATPFFPTATPTGNWVWTAARSVYVRAGPGRTFLRLADLAPGDVVEPVARNEDTTWVMIRLRNGFGWITYNAVRWVTDVDSLPVVSADNLTPSPTYTATRKPTVTVTPSNTPSPTASDTATLTPTLTPTATDTPSSTPTPTVTDTTTATSTLTSTATFTEVPTNTATPTDKPTETPLPTTAATFTQPPTDTATIPPTDTATVSPSPTDTLTNTPSPAATLIPTENIEATSEILVLPSRTPRLTATNTPTRTPRPTIKPTATPTNTPSRTPTQTATSSATNTPKPTVTDTPTLTVTIAPTNTPQPSATHTSTPTNTPRPTNTSRPATNTPVMLSETPLAPTATVTPIQSAGVLPGTPEATVTRGPQTAAPPTGNLPLEAIVGGAGLLAVVGYAGLYWLGLRGMERYAGGFVVRRCPVCHKGELHVETRQERFLGIPRGRRIVRCSECRSVLREVGNRRWRYAVDPIENPALYRQYNGREIDEKTLTQLSNQPASVVPRPTTPPTFIDDEEPK